MRKTKIVCTIGPACESEAIMTEMLKSGMDVARLNFSHGTHETHGKYIDTFRKVRDKLGIPAAVMLDTKGPEIRLRTFEGGKTTIKKGDTFILTNEQIVGDNKRASVTLDTLPSQLKPDDEILINDGQISLKVESTTEKDIICKVMVGGELSDKKGINIPAVFIDMPFLSDADCKDLRFGIEKDVDFIAASFVRNKDDIIEMRKYLDYYDGHKIRIIAKIENMHGVNNFDEILQYSDGIMVARGDMGVEIDFRRLPGLQKRFISRCYQSGKMVITATQMLESMVKNPRPTRAEITDVANAVFDGTSAIMLSGESAIGKYPLEAVRAMAGIAEYAERDAFEMQAYKDIKLDNERKDITNAICDATCRAATDIEAKAIIALTTSGATARNMSKFRPQHPIVAATTEMKTYHQLALSWGVYPVLSRYQTTTDKLFIHAVDCAKKLNLVDKGDRVVITGGVPLRTEGSTNILKVQVVE